jgi:hypothetical protein
MKARVSIIIIVAIGLTVLISTIRGGFDPEHPSLACCLLMVIVFVSLVSAVRSGLDRSIPMSRASRIVRVVGGSIWALAIVGGMAVQVWRAMHR